MSLPLPPAIEVEAVRDDVSYLLPVRPLGPLRWAGAVFIGVGALFLWTPVNGLISLLKRVLDGSANANEWFGGLFNVPFLIGGLIPLGLGLLLLFGRCRVELRHGRLSVLDYAGLIRWRRRLPKDRVRMLMVRTGGLNASDKAVTSGPFADLGALTAEFESAQSRALALGYPRDWLQALAEDLSARLGAAASTVAAPLVTVTHFDEEPPPCADLTEQPSDSSVRVEASLKGFVLVVPPAGLRKGSKGLFGFGVIWCLFMAVFTGLAGFSNGKASGPPGGAWVLIGLFWLIGLGMLAGAINMGRRRAMLRVDENRLSAAQIGLFGGKRWDWRREELADIRADGSGMKVNDVPVIELQIHPISGRKVGLFAGRDERELRWMATKLRRALHVGGEKLERAG